MKCNFFDLVAATPDATSALRLLSTLSSSYDFVSAEILKYNYDQSELTV